MFTICIVSGDIPFLLLRKSFPWKEFCNAWQKHLSSVCHNRVLKKCLGELRERSGDKLIKTKTAVVASLNLENKSGRKT